jgi:hypothetical protein
MRETTLIIQVKVGDAAGYDYNKPMGNLFENVLMPSVRRYCEKNEYDYLLIEEYPKEYDINFFHTLNPKNKNKGSTLIRYLNMNRNYDRIVSLDNDIWIPKHAQRLPEINGHMAVRDIGKSWRESKTPNLAHGKFVNGGVQMVDRATGLKIHEYFKTVVKEKIPPINDYHSDQSYLNDWRGKNAMFAHLLDKKWNFMVSCHERRNNYNGINFVHYAGAEARDILHDDLANGVLK